MKKWIKYITAFLWMVIFNYLFDLKNFQELIIALPLGILGLLLIFYLFERKDRNKKSQI